jgi:hypothetical protein
MIRRLSGPSRFLSSFFRVPVVHRGVRFPSVEHAYRGGSEDVRGTRTQS